MVFEENKNNRICVDVQLLKTDEVFVKWEVMEKVKGNWHGLHAENMVLPAGVSEEDAQNKGASEAKKFLRATEAQRRAEGMVDALNKAKK